MVGLAKPPSELPVLPIVPIVDLPLCLIFGVAIALLQPSWSGYVTYWLRAWIPYPSERSILQRQERPPDRRYDKASAKSECRPLLPRAQRLPSSRLSAAQGCRSFF